MTLGRYGICVLIGHRWIIRSSGEPRGLCADGLWWHCPRCGTSTITCYKRRRPPLDWWIDRGRMVDRLLERIGLERIKERP